MEWKLENVDSRKDGVTLRYGAGLSKTAYRVERSITLPADETVAYVEESVENMEPYDRPMQWTQHITFGPPFLELGKTFADGSVAKVVMMRGRESVAEDTWPRIKDSEGRAADLRAFSGRSNTWLMDASKPKVWVTMYHAEYPVLIGYIFESKPNQWVFDWQENQRATEKPWDGKVIARAICIGDSVVGGLRNAVERGSMFGVPAYSWIEARERRTQKYAVFLAEIPPGFKGVAALRTENGQIVIEERETGKKMAIKSGRAW